MKKLLAILLALMLCLSSCVVFAEEPAAPLTASAPGFIGQPVGVTVTLNADGTIATLEIDVSKQVPPVCDLVLDESFTNQFIGQAGPFVKGENVDGVTGATFTSDAVIVALNSLFPVKAPVVEEPVVEEPVVEEPVV